MTLTVGFECQESPSQDLKAFQQAGHFVPAMKDTNGFRRQWDGCTVYFLTLNVIRKGVPPLQTLRIVADSPEECQRLMIQAIQDTLFANWAHEQQANFDRAQWLELNERRNQFSEFLQLHYSREIESGKHSAFKDVFDAAVHYMRKERNQLRHRIGRFFRREKLAAGSDWLPKEWRG